MKPTELFQPHLIIIFIFLLFCSEFVLNFTSDSLGETINFIGVHNPNPVHASNTTGVGNTLNETNTFASKIVFNEGRLLTLQASVPDGGWSKEQKTEIVGLHYWAQLAFLAVSGFILRSTDGMQTYAAAIGLCTVSVAIFPFTAAHIGYYGARIVRLVIGFSHAFYSPGVEHLISLYIPQALRSLAYAISIIGIQLCPFALHEMCKKVCHVTWFLGGWPTVFYAGVVFGIIWLFFWEIQAAYFNYHERCRQFVYTVNTEKPKLSFKFDPEEKLHESIGTYFQHCQTASYRFWLKFYNNVLTEPAMLALIPCSFAQAWTTGLYAHFLLEYYNDVLVYDMEGSGYSLILPVLAKNIAKVLASGCSFLIKTFIYHVEPSVMSKIFNTIGFVGGGGVALLAAYINIAPTPAVWVVVIGCGLYSCCTPGFKTSIISVNPNWTSVISSFCNMAYVLGAVSVKYLHKELSKKKTVSECRTLFAIVLLVDIVAAVMYIVFGTVKTREVRIEEKRKASLQAGNDKEVGRF